jgi:hypothetical protein
LAYAGTVLVATDDAPVLDDATASTDQPASAPAIQPQPEAKPSINCHPRYPDFCIPPPPPDLNCSSAVLADRSNFAVLSPDPHHFDADHDGVGCESRR